VSRSAVGACDWEEALQGAEVLAEHGLRVVSVVV
jgi:hypothetical protein